MKNITFSADEHLIEQARALAQRRHSTLNVLFREWLEELTRREQAGSQFDELTARLERSLSFERKLSRDELNER